MRLRAGRPADPCQGVDERAALDPEGAADRGFRRTAFERRDDGRDLFRVDRDRAAAVPTAASRGGKTGANPLLGQGALELRQRSEDMEEEFALRGGGVHLLGQRAECDAAILLLVYCREQMGQRSPETVELPHHKAIARLEEGQRLPKAGTIIAAAAGAISPAASRASRCKSRTWRSPSVETRM